MKEVVKVSISGIAFTFEQDAYNTMKEYISRLEAGYMKNPDGREIVADIEARIAELILNEQESDKVVDLALVQSVVEQLGYPEDMAAETESLVDKMPKRLYRNQSGAVLGGVCSGLGTYLRVDAVWIRLIFFLPLLLSVFESALFHAVYFLSFNILGQSHFFGSMFGMFVVLYVVLWISVPMARTPRQKLEMRGERITASSIRHTFEEDIPDDSSPRRRKSASVWADAVYGLGRIIQFFIKAIVFIIALVVGMCAIVILVGLVALLFTGNIIGGLALLEAFDGMAGITPAVFVALICLAALIPLFLVCYFLLKLLFGSKTNRNFMLILAIIWVALIIYLSAVTAYNSKNISDGVDKLIYSNSVDLDADFDFDADGSVVIHSKNGGKSIIINKSSYEEYLDDLDDEDVGVTLRSGNNSIIINKPSYKEYLDELNDENVSIKVQPYTSNDTLRVSKITLNPANPKDTLKVENFLIDKKVLENAMKSQIGREVLKSSVGKKILKSLEF